MALCYNGCECRKPGGQRARWYPCLTLQFQLLMSSYVPGPWRVWFPAVLYCLYSRLFKLLKQKLREAKYQAQVCPAGEAWCLESIWFSFQLHPQLRIYAECQGRKCCSLEFQGEAKSLFWKKQNRQHSSRNLFQFTSFNITIEIFICAMHQLYNLKSKRFNMSN